MTEDERRDPGLPWGNTQGDTPGSGGGSRRRWFWIILAAAGLVALIAALIGEFPEAVAGEDGKFRLVYLVLLLVLVAGGTVLRWRHRPGLVTRHALIWTGIGLILVLGYSFGADVTRLGQRLWAELLPHRGMATGEDAIAFARGADGHFRIEAQVDGISVRFLLDTGASVVTLSPDDARRMGFDLGALRFTQTFQTANGTVKGAPVRLREVRIGPILVRDVRASVNGAPMAGSLLGMSFLDRLGGYDVRGARLTLRR